MVDSGESLLNPPDESQETAHAHTQDSPPPDSRPDSVNCTQRGDSGLHPLSLEERSGSGLGMYHPRRRDAQGRTLTSRTSEAQLRSAQRWYTENQLVRASFPMPRALWIQLREHAKQTKQTLWRMATRMLQEALDRERTTPVDAAQNVEELLR